MVENRPQRLRALVALIVIACAAAAQALTLSDRFRSPRNPERKVRSSTRLVVLHTTEAHARSSLNKLCERGEAHYCVIENGTVYRIIDREREAFHAGRSMWNGAEDCDKYSIGIEVVGHHDKPITLQQAEALRELLAHLKKIYRLQDHQVIAHSHVAYGAPNRWFKFRHRGRKRCGMLFAMPNIRARLGLRSKPSYDPDVRAGRLRQADPHLANVLYGNVDTIRVGAPAPAPANSGIIAGLKGWFSSSPQSAAKPAAAPPAAKPAATKPAPARPGVKAPAKSPARPAPVTKPAKPTKPVRPAQSAKPAPKRDPVKDLAALKSLPGYVQCGTVGPNASPFKLAGAAWRAPTTYYFYRGTITPGDRIDPKKVVPGTIVFRKK